MSLSKDEIEFEILKIDSKISYAKMKRELYYGANKEIIHAGVDARIKDLEKVKDGFLMLYKRIK